MPKVMPLTTDKQLVEEWKELTKRIYLDCKKKKIRNKDLAEVLNVDPSTIAKQFSNGNIQTLTILAYERLKGERE